MPFRFLLKTLLVLALLGYPILVYLGLSYVDVRVMALVLLCVLVVRALMLPRQYRYRIWGMVAIGSVIVVLVTVFNDPLYLRLYPVMMSGFMLGVFIFSLYFPPTVIEVFARLHFKGKEMPAHVIQYTRNVTKVWCGFLFLNGMVATYTIFCSLAVWTLYNGLISYILMGTLFVTEFLYRQLIVKKRAPAHDA